MNLMRLVNSKKQRGTALRLIIAVLTVLFLGTCFYLCSRTAAEKNFDNDDLLNLAINGVFSVYGLVLLLIMLLDNTEFSWDLLYIILIDINLMMSLCLNIVTYYLEGFPEYDFLNKTACFFSYVTCGFVYYLTWRVSRVILDLNKPCHRVVDRILLGTVALYVVLLVFNLSYGFMYSYDSDGIFHESESLVVTSWVSFFHYGAILYFALISKKSVTERVTATIICLVPVFMYVVEAIFTAIENDIPFTFISVMFIFVGVYGKKTIDLQSRERDLDFAASIQRGILPVGTFSDPSGRFEICGMTEIPREMGGSFYDYRMLSDGTFAFVCGMVNMVGAPAALCMMQTVSTIRNFSNAGFKGPDLLNMSNRSLAEYNEEGGAFVNLWRGCLNPDTGELTYMNAGHRYPLLFRANGEFEQPDGKSGLPLAAMDDTRYKEFKIKLNPGDLLILCSDGITEAKKRNGEMFGIRGEREAVKDPSLRLSDICSGIIGSAETFAYGPEITDDMTVLALRCKGEAKL